jgi:DNA-binding LacI/PurR family transcriptional regulator
MIAIMMRIPRRISLTAQTVAILRAALRAGRWKDVLPGEHTLADELRVSRKTIRVALAGMQKEGLISSSQGRRHRLLRPVRASGRAAAHIVGWLGSRPWHGLQPFVIFCIDQVRRRLQDQGRELMFRLEPRATTKRANATSDLERVVLETAASCWVLCRVREETQRWFQQRRIPALVFGSTYPGVDLPSLDLDFRTTCRHAAGVCFRRGHRRVALVLPEPKVAGVMAMERGFREAFDDAPRRRNGKVAAAVPSVVYHDGSVAGICQAVDSLRHAPQRPTALLVVTPRHVLTVITECMRRGIRVPEDMSLISIEFDWFLNDLAIPIAHYEIGLERMAGQLVRSAAVLAAGGALPARHTLLMPRFVDGATLGPPSD